MQCCFRGTFKRKPVSDGIPTPLSPGANNVAPASLSSLSGATVCDQGQDQSSLSLTVIKSCPNMSGWPKWADATNGAIGVTVGVAGAERVCTRRAAGLALYCRYCPAYTVFRCLWCMCCCWCHWWACGTAADTRLLNAYSLSPSAGRAGAVAMAAAVVAADKTILI